MGHLGGSASSEIDAPIERVWAVVQDVLSAPDWQGGLDAMSALEDLDGERTLATFHLDVDPGRMLGMLIRGPVEAATRAIFVNGRPGELKRRVEGAG